MRLTCRSCGATGSAEQVFGDAEAAEALTLAGDLDPVVARAVWPYLALFRPGSRSLTWARTRKLLEELLTLMREPTIRRHHRDWTVTPLMWRTAIEQMTGNRDRLILPLKSHGYLLEILAGLADKTEADAERLHEAGVRNRSGDGKPASDAVPVRVDLALMDLQGERDVRKRLKHAPMTQDEEQAFLAKRRGHHAA